MSDYLSSPELTTVNSIAELAHLQAQLGQLQARAAASTACAANCATELHRVDRTLRILSHFNRALVRATDETALLQNLCDTIVTIGGYQLAWVELRLPDQSTNLTLVASAGAVDDDPRNWIEAMQPTVNSVLNRALSTGQPQILRASCTAPKAAPGPEVMWLSDIVMILPLIDYQQSESDGIEHQVLGCLNLNTTTCAAWTEAEVDLWQELSGDLVYGLAMLRRQQAQRQAEVSLRQSEVRLSLALEAAQMGIWDWDLHTGTITWSRGHEELFGLAPGGFDGRYETFDACLHPDDRAALHQSEQQAIAIHGIYYNEYRVVWPDGSIHWIEGRGQAFYDATGQAVRMTGTVMDISDRKQTAASLQQSQQQYRTLAEAAPVGIFWADAAGNALYVNERWCKITQLASAAAQGSGWANALHPDDHDRVCTAWQQAVQTQQVFQAEYRLQRPDGTIIWVFGQAIAETDLTGQVTGYVGTITDITARKQAEDALRCSEEKFRIAFEQSPVAIALVGLDGQFLKLNQVYSQLFDYTLDELMTMTFVELTHPDDLALAMAHTEQLVSGEIADFQLEKRYFHKTGRIIYGLLNVALVTDAHGQPLHAIEQIVDITPRKQAEQALQQANTLLEMRVAERTANLTQVNRQLQQELQERQKVEQKLRHNQGLLQAIVDNSPAFIYIQDQTGRILLANRQYADLFHLTPEQLVGRYQQDILPHPLADHCATHTQAILATSEPIAVEEVVDTEQGLHTYWLIKFPLFNAVGQLYAICGIATDITERTVVARLKDEFMAIVSHELRTPLTSIHTALNLFVDGLLDPQSPPGQQVLKIAADSTDRLAHLVNDILDLERLESGQLRFIYQSWQLADLMIKATEQMQVIADQAGIILSTVPLVIDLYVDGERLIQVLTNLLNNAIKFSPRGHTVWLTADRHIEAEQPFILLQVKDQGRGIDPTQLENIFDRFHQVDISDARPKGGVGLGLPICRYIVQHHGGQIWAESTVGVGSCFYVKLPLRSP
jgi:PAS domain S-box-containing protein